MRRVGRIFDRTSQSRDLDDELAAFVEELTRRNIAQGMTPDEARRAALIETGGVQQVRELTRDTWTFSSLESVGRDVRYGCRMLARSPGFAAVVVATLAVAIGANATMFSVMHAVLWRPLPYPASERLVVLDANASGVSRAGLAGAESRDLQNEPELFDQVASLVSVDAHVNVDGAMERVPAASATDDALGLLGAEPLAHGRRLSGERDGGIDSPVRSVVISHELWQRRLGGDPAAIGRHIEVNNLDVEIVGILRPDFRVYLPANANFPEVVDIWFARGFEADRRYRSQVTLARLHSGVSVDAARSRLNAVSQRFSRDYENVYGDAGVHVFADPLHEVLTSEVSGALWVLAAAVGFVLIIACVNVANLMLARARVRAREIAVRRALGAGQLRLVRQLLTETAVLALLGGLIGLALAHGGVAVVDWLGPRHLPRQSMIAVTTEVAAFIATLAIGITVALGCLPAFGSAHDAHAPLRSGRSTVQRPGMRRLQRGLVISEIALSIVPLVAAGLMLRTFANLIHEPLGFDASHLVTAKVAFSFREYPDVHSRWTLHREILAQVRQLPGVQDVSGGAQLPFDTPQLIRAVARDGEVPRVNATAQSVLPGYVRVTRTPVLAGRDFTDDDIASGRAVVIVDQRLASQLWPTGAVGQRLVMLHGRNTIQLEVIGVIPPIHVAAVRNTPLPHLLLPYHVFPIEQALVIRTTTDVASIGPMVKQAVESLGTRRPVYDIRPLQSYVDASLVDTRFMTLVLSGFGMASILLAAVGLYGTLAYLTSLRTQEFGVRMALGASAGRVLRTVANEGLVLAAIGAAVGVAGALAATDLMQGLLYNVTPLDGVTLTSVIVLVAAAALVAALHPAWRASRTNPTLVLRAGE